MSFFFSQKGKVLADVVTHMIAIPGEHVVGNRLGRREPRAVKKRPKPYARLQHSRPHQ